MNPYSISNRERRYLSDNLRRITNFDERDTIIACLYVNGDENVNRLAKLFNLKTEKIIAILEKEQLYDCKICTGCFKLKTYDEYWKRSGDKNRGIMSKCKKCVGEIKRNNEESMNYSKESIKEFRSNPVNYQKRIAKCKQLDFIDENREDENGFLEVKCTYCGRWYNPNGQDLELRVKAISGKYDSNTENRFYCGSDCKRNCPIYRVSALVLMIRDSKEKNTASDRSREVQPELRKLVFNRDKYTCVKCNKKQSELCTGLHCHHIEGIRWNPLESADIDQCITVCEFCHEDIHKTSGCKYYEMRCNEIDRN